MLRECYAFVVSQTTFIEGQISGTVVLSTRKPNRSKLCLMQSLATWPGLARDTTGIKPWSQCWRKCVWGCLGEKIQEWIIASWIQGLLCSWGEAQGSWKVPPRSDPWSPFSEIILAKMSRRENGIVSHKRRYHLPLPSRLGEGGQD